MKPRITTTGLSVYIIEDDDMFRDTFMDAMSMYPGVKVSGASSGVEALRALKDLVPSVLIIDVQLPDIHGFELCRLIKRSERHKDVPVVFLTASSRYNDPRDRAEGFISGAALFLSKPISMETVWKEIENILK